MDTDTQRKRLRVLEVVKPPDGTTRYIDQVVAFASDDIAFSYVSIKQILRGRYDLVHFHWPEMMIKDRRLLVEAVKSLSLRIWLVILAFRKVAVVRTLHNLQPHEEQRWAVRRALEALDEATDLFIAINENTPLPEGGEVILHGHYRSRFESLARASQESGLLLYAGMLRPYKGVEELLDSFQTLDHRDLRLRIVGRPTSELREVVMNEVRRCPERVSARLDFIPDADFVQEISAAELVCLPYRELHNSGMALVALSLDRPVLVPATETTLSLAAEVGPGWVHTYTGELGPDDITRALEAVRTGSRSGSPQLEGRDWERVGRGYSEAFRRARVRVLRRQR